MKTVFVILCFSAIFYTVRGTCWSCKQNAKPCGDSYTPPASDDEATVCVKTDPVLCRKYSGSYSVGCFDKSGFSLTSFSCSLTCGGHRLTPGILLILVALGVLIFNKH